MNDVLDRAGDRPGHIFNLGHGLLPDTPVANIELAIATVRARARRSGGGTSAPTSSGSGGSPATAGGR